MPCLVSLHLEARRAGFQHTLTFEKMEPNIEVDDSIFVMPETEESDEEAEE